MSNSSDSHLFEGLVHHSVKSTVKLLDQCNKPGKDNLNRADPDFALVAEVGLLLTGLLTFLGAGTAKILFKKNPNIERWEVYQLILITIVFGGLGVWGLFMSNEKDTVASSDSFFIFGILYCILAIVILVRGLSHYNSKLPKSNMSILTVFLEKENWSQKQITKWGEPLFLIIIGGVCTAFNPLAGIPLGVCVLSIWLHLLKDYLRGSHSQQEELENINKKSSSQDEFNYVQ